MLDKIIGIASNVIGGIFSKKSEKNEQVAQAPAAQQPSVFQNNAQGTVKMEIPVHLAGTVARVINANA